MSELTTFRSRAAGYALHIGTKQLKVGPDKYIDVADKIQFVNGVYTTDDPKHIQYLKETQDFRQGRIAVDQVQLNQEEVEAARQALQSAKDKKAASTPFKV